MQQKKARENTRRKKTAAEHATCLAGKKVNGGEYAKIPPQTPEMEKKENGKWKMSLPNLITVRI